jgi:glutamate/aspartate transport system substrate-binding protein
MKRVISFSCLLWTALSAQAGTIDKAAQSGEITLAYREASVPFSYLEAPDKPIGFAVDIAKAVADAVGHKVGKPVRIQWLPVTSANRIAMVQNGTVDLECGSTTDNAQRRKDVDFAVSHFYSGTRLLVKKSSEIRNYDNLKGKLVVSTTGTTNVQLLHDYSDQHGIDMQLALMPDHNAAFQVVENDGAVAFGMDDILLYGLIAAAKQPDQFEVVGDSLHVEPYGCMLHKDDPEFKKLVDGVIINLMGSGQLQKLYDRWFMQPIPPRNIALKMPMSPELKGSIIGAVSKYVVGQLNAQEKN